MRELPVTIPEGLVDLLTTNVVAHVAALRPDGSIAGYLMWVDFDGDHVLTSSPVGSRKGRHWRRNPQASVAVMDPADPWRFLILRGRVTDIQPDEGLAFIDRMSTRYVGGPYRRRDGAREVFTITLDHFRASYGRR